MNAEFLYVLLMAQMLKNTTISVAWVGCIEA